MGVCMGVWQGPNQYKLNNGLFLQPHDLQITGEWTEASGTRVQMPVFGIEHVYMLKNTGSLQLGYQVRGPVATSTSTTKQC